MDALGQEYREARFSEYAVVSRNMALAGCVLVLALWVRDYVYDPALAPATLGLRLLIAATALLYAGAISFKAPRAMILASGYLSLFVMEFVIIEVWARLGAPYSAIFPAYLFIYLLLPLVMLPFTFRENAVSLLLVPLVPNLQALTGMAPGFPLLAFNAFIWPACAIALFANGQFDRLLRKLYLSRVELRELATQDSLTGLANRRGLLWRAEQILKLARRHGRKLSVLMLDLDHFKAVNDRFGHAAGDDVLRFVATTIGLQLRATDICARTGGEEFVVVLPETGLEEALVSAERIRTQVAASAIPSDEAKAPLRVTISVGVAAYPASGDALEALLAQADKALYEAKRRGRDRVCAAPSPKPGLRGLQSL